MSRFFLKQLILIGLIVASPSIVKAELPKHPLIQLALQTQSKNVRKAVEQGAQVHLTSDRKSYYLLWLPEGTDLNNLPPLIVSIHGHDGCAFTDFSVWFPFLKERGYGLLAIQWWLGKGEGLRDYLLPQEIYRVIDQVFKENRVMPGKAMLQGFSRGSANIYAVAAMDRQTHNNYFSLFVANAGMASLDYPPTRDIDSRIFGEQPFLGTHWVTFAGGRDPNPDRDGINGMRQTALWLKKMGATVDLSIEDLEADHGGFHRRPQNCNRALDLFDQLRKRN